MNSIPANYDLINEYCGNIAPSTIHTQNNHLFYYFRRYLLQKALSVLKWELPDGWDYTYFLYTLYCWGYIAIFDTAQYGVIPQRCALTGYNIYYAPVKIIATPPGAYETYERTIGKDCVLLKLSPDYSGIVDMLNQYAERLALCAQAISVNLVNSKLSYVFTASDKAGAETFKKMFDRIISGEPAVFADSKTVKNDDGSNRWQMFTQNLKSNYLVTDILADMRKIENMFATDIGIPNANSDKRERLIADEVNANNVETVSRTSLWLESLQAGCKQIKKMFNVDINVDWRFPMEGGETNETIDFRTLQLQP